MSRKFCAVIGQPIKHSLSDVLHLSAYKHLGLDLGFKKIEVGSSELKNFFTQLDPDCLGLAVTRPLKENIFVYLDHVDGLAKICNAVNTVARQSSSFVGFNTDVYGISGAIKNNEKYQELSSPQALILGSGATATSALAALQEFKPANISVISRTTGGVLRHRAFNMGLEVKFCSWSDSPQVSKLISEADLIVNTVPSIYQHDLPLPAVSSRALVLEAAYEMWPTIFATAFMGGGATVIPGWEMLIYQGLAQIKLFTGAQVEAPVVREAILQELRARSILK